jgi:GNAT superfamily N-acetyltransferase
LFTFSTERLSLRKLGIGDDTGFFDCGDSYLNDYIRFQAKDQQLEHAAVVYLAWFDTQIVGFLSLNMSSIEVSNIGRRHRPLHTPYRYYPSLMIGRLATELLFQRKGVGRMLCLYAIATAVRLCDEAGCQFVILNAKKPSVYFYARCGFKLAENQPKGRHEPFMYFKFPEQGSEA